MGLIRALLGPFIWDSLGTHSCGLWARPLHLGPGLGPICSNLCVCHKRGQNKEWAAVRTLNIRDFRMRISFIFIILHKQKLLVGPSACHELPAFLSFYTLLRAQRFAPEMPQKCLGTFGDLPRHILDHFQYILQQNRQTNNY